MKMRKGGFLNSVGKHLARNGRLFVNSPPRLMGFRERYRSLNDSLRYFGKRMLMKGYNISPVQQSANAKIEHRRNIHASFLLISE